MPRAGNGYQSVRSARACRVQ